MKKILVNLKDWFNLEENIKFAKDCENLDLTIFPSLPFLYLFSNISNLEIGIQDVSLYSSGAHTGFTSLEHLADFNIKWAIINHKESVKMDSNDIYQKISICQSNNIKVVLCINEIAETNLCVITDALLKIKDYTNIFIAYEPTIIDTEDNYEKNISYLIKYLNNKTNYTFPFIFGGNISSSNIVKYKDNKNIIGFLLSRHALDIEELKTIINIVK